MTAALTGCGQALPPAMDQQWLWDGFFREHYADERLARKVWEHSGITTRRGVVDPTAENISSWGTAARMTRFLAEAMPLGREAVDSALHDADLDPADVGLFTVRVVHRLRNAGPGHLARTRPGNDRRRPASAHRSHGLLRSPSRARRHRRLRRGPRSSGGNALRRAHQPARAAQQRDGEQRRPDSRGSAADGRSRAVQRCGSRGGARAGTGVRAGGPRRCRPH